MNWGGGGEGGERGRAESWKKELVLGSRERTFGSSDFSAEQTFFFFSSALSLSHHWKILYKAGHSCSELGRVN